MTRITHKTAVLAKEKGFNLRCEQYYSNQTGDHEVAETISEDLYLLQRRRHGIYEVYVQDYNTNSGEIILPYNYGEPMLIDEGDCSAPRQSELQKWLREEHNILVIVDIDPDIYNGKVNYTADVKNCDNNSDAIGIRLLDGFTKFQSYEEALEEGLLQALNLIP
jgi:hypothetical protein